MGHTHNLVSFHGVVMPNCEIVGEVQEHGRKMQDGVQRLFQGSFADTGNGDRGSGQKVIEASSQPPPPVLVNAGNITASVYADMNYLTKRKNLVTWK